MATASDQKQSGWAFTELLRETWARFQEGWQSYSTPVRRRFALTLIIGFVVLCGVEIAVAQGLEAYIDGEEALPWEMSMMRWMIDAPVSRTAVRWLDVWGNALVTWPIVFFAGGFAAWKKRALHAIAILPAYLATEVFTLGGWWLWSRQRPHLESGDEIGWHSFPSGHVIHVVFVFGLLCWMWAQSTNKTSEKIAAAVVPIAIALGVAFIRLRMSVHWPLDVGFGLFIGALWLAVVIGALKYAQKEEPELS